MKKRIAVFMLAVTMVFTGAQAFAAGAGTGRYYVDADGDGICDNRQADGLTGSLTSCVGAGCLRYVCDGSQRRAGAQADRGNGVGYGAGQADGTGYGAGNGYGNGSGAGQRNGAGHHGGGHGVCRNI